MSTVCTRCGTTFESGNFCPGCGTPVAAFVSNPAPATEDIPATVYAAAPQEPYTQPAPTYQQPYNTQYTAPQQPQYTQQQYTQPQYTQQSDPVYQQQTYSANYGQPAAQYYNAPAHAAAQPSVSDKPKKKKGLAVTLSIVAALVLIVVAYSVAVVMCLPEAQGGETLFERICFSNIGVFDGDTGHDWMDATCTEAKTCEACDKTRGKALGHEWEDATCTEPETCERCDKTQGDALGHNWREATMDTPSTCSVCAQTTGMSVSAEMMVGTWIVSAYYLEGTVIDGSNLYAELTVNEDGTAVLAASGLDTTYMTWEYFKDDSSYVYYAFYIGSDRSAGGLIIDRSNALYGSFMLMLDEDNAMIFEKN